MSDLRQQPYEQVHTLNTRITNLVNKCSFQEAQTTETIKIMLLQHAFRYRKACNWIHLQDPATLTYKTLTTLQIIRTVMQAIQKGTTEG